MILNNILNMHELSIYIVSLSFVPWHFLWVDNELDFGSSSEIEGLLLLHGLSLNLSKHVEVRIKHLVVIFVSMDTNFVVMDGVVFPLRYWFHVQEFHE